MKPERFEEAASIGDNLNAKRTVVLNLESNAGRVLVNGQPAKASRDIKPGDKLEIQFGQRTVKIEVLNVADTVKKEAAADMYREI